MMERRNFLRLLLGTPIAAALNTHRVIFDMGRKLWTPPSVTEYYRRGFELSSSMPLNRTRIDFLDLSYWGINKFTPAGLDDYMWQGLSRESQQ